LLDLQHL